MHSATISLDSSSVVGPVCRRLFGSFVEHLGRCVYDGIYEPGHVTAHSDGFRQDVLDLVRELGVTTIRYPGGNFVSGYRWEDGVGPHDLRPRRLDLAWHSVETNQVGLDEFGRWLDRAGSELMYAVNLGTRGVQEALDILEYANIRGGTSLSEARIAHGRVAPYDIRMWCLGNEMDGDWQLGHRSAEDYAALAVQTARAMRQIDPQLELVVCGSSSSSMPTFGAWERTVLEHTYDEVDYISCHAYYEPHDGDLDSFLASAVDMDSFIERVAAIADDVKEARGSDKQIAISFDEWNVWYQSRYSSVEKITDVESWPVAPRLLEDCYTVLDAVVVGSLLICLLRHADRVTSASLAQLVNVIAPIMTEPGGAAWRQTTFFPFAATSRLAHGTSLRLRIECDTIDTAEHGAAGLIDAAATLGEDGRVCLFLVNRCRTGPTRVSVDLSGFPVDTVDEVVALYDADIFAGNTLQDQTRVSTTDDLAVVISNGNLIIDLPLVSWAAIVLTQGADHEG